MEQSPLLFVVCSARNNTKTLHIEFLTKFDILTWRKAGAQDEAKAFAQLMCNFIYLYVFAFFITNQSALALNVTHVNPMVELEVKTE